MGYFEGLTNGLFKKDQKDNTVFFPWGVLGKGRILPNESAEVKVRAFVSLYYKVSLPTIIGVSVIFGGTATFLLVPIFLAWSYFGLKSLISKYPYSEEKLTIKDSYRNSASGHQKGMLWVLFICSMLFVVTGLFLATVATAFSPKAIGVLLAIIFGMCSAALWFMIKVKRKE